MYFQYSISNWALIEKVDWIEQYFNLFKSQSVSIVRLVFKSLLPTGDLRRQSKGLGSSHSFKEGVLIQHSSAWSGFVAHVPTVKIYLLQSPPSSVSFQQWNYFRSTAEAVTWVLPSLSTILLLSFKVFGLKCDGLVERFTFAIPRSFPFVKNRRCRHGRPRRERFPLVV